MAASKSKKKSAAKKTAGSKKKTTAGKKKPAKTTSSATKKKTKSTTKKTGKTKSATKSASSAGAAVDEKKLAKAVADAVKPAVDKVEKAVRETHKKVDAVSKAVDKAEKAARNSAGPDAKAIAQEVDKQVSKTVGKEVRTAIQPTADELGTLGKEVAATSQGVNKLVTAIDELPDTPDPAPAAPAIDTTELATAVAEAVRRELDGLHDAIQDSYKMLESVKRLAESVADATDRPAAEAPAVDAEAIGAAIAGALDERLGSITDELAALRSSHEALARENQSLRRVQAVEAEVDPVIDSGSHGRDEVLAALDDDDDDGADADGDGDDDSDVSAEDLMAAASQSGESEAIALDNRARQTLAKIDHLRDTCGSSLNERQVWNEVVIFYGNDGRDLFYRDLGVLYDSGRLVGLPMLTAEVLDRRGEFAT